MKLAKKAFVYIFLLGIGIFLFVDIIVDTGVDNIVTALRNFSVVYFAAYFLVQFVNFLFQTWRWQYILKHFKYKISFMKLILHRYAGWAVSFLTPSAQLGGDPIRVVLLGKEGVRRRDAVFSVIVDRVLQLTGLIIFVLMGFAFLFSRHLVTKDIFFTFGIALIFFVCLLVWFYIASIKDIGFFSSIFRALRLNKFARFRKTYNKTLIIEEALREFYTDHWGKFVWLLVLSVIGEAYEIIEYLIIGHFMGFDFTFSEVFLIRSLPCLAYLIPIPGALGVLEGGHAAMFALLGIDINVFVFVLIVRIRDLINVFIGLAHISGSGISTFKRYVEDKFKKGWFRKRYPRLFG